MKWYGNDEPEDDRIHHETAKAPPKTRDVLARHRHGTEGRQGRETRRRTHARGGCGRSTGRAESLSVHLLGSTDLTVRHGDLRIDLLTTLQIATSTHLSLSARESRSSLRRRHRESGP